MEKKAPKVALVILVILLLVSTVGIKVLKIENQSLKAAVEYLQTGYIDPPEIIGEIETSELSLFLREILGEEAFGDPDQKAPIYLLDREYKLTTVEEIERFLEIDTTDQYKYTSEYLDCDNFALKLMGRIIMSPDWSGIAFGIMVAQFDVDEQCHAFNVFVTKENGELVLYWIEPQNDSIEKIEKGSIYKVKFVIF